jgi:hypothetical protein
MENTTIGMCRRKAPFADEYNGFGRSWPNVRIDDWCGEYSPALASGEGEKVE